METTQKEKKTKSLLKRHVLADELDSMMVVVRPKGWLAIYSGLAILLIIIIWSFVGRIPIIVSGLAISLSSEGTYVVIARAQGTVVEILAHSGQEVKKGDVLVKVADPISYLAIQVQEQKIEVMQTNLKELREKIAQEDKDRQESIQKKITSEEFALANSEGTIPYLEKDLESKIRLNEQGIISQPDVEKARTELIRTKNAIQQHKANILSLQADKAVAYRAGEIKVAESALFDAKNQLERQMLERSFLEIRSDKDGTILEIDVAIGNQVKEGQVVATVELPLTEGQQLRFYAAIGGEYGVLLKEKLPVQIEVAGIDPKQYGYLLGKIDFVSPYPVSQAEMTAAVANPQLAEFLKGGQQAVYSLSIVLIPDESTQSGFAWTTRYGPPKKISTGTLAIARIVVEEKRPIFYVLPEEIGPYVQEALPHPTQAESEK